MPRLPSVGSRQMVQALLRAGFVEDRQKGSHLVLLHPETRRRATVPMHGRTLKAGTTRAILRQAGLTAEEFRRLLK